MDTQVLETLQIIAELLKMLVMFKCLDYGFKALRFMGIFHF